MDDNETVIEGGIDLLDTSTEEENEEKIMDIDVNLTNQDSLLLLSFKLPVSVTKLDSGGFVLKESRSMLYPTIFRLREKGIVKFQWIGWPGIFPKDDTEKEQITILLKAHRCCPVWATKKEIEQFILFSEQHMRPMFHGFKGANENDLDAEVSDLWHNFCDVNKKFVE